MISKETLRLAQDGDADSMEVVLEEAGEFISSFVFTHIESRADAEDVAAEAIKSVFGHLQRQYPIRNFDAWVSKIAWSKINDFHRQRFRGVIEIPMSSSFADEEYGTDGDDEFGVPSLDTIRYAPEARREMMEAERTFRGN